MGRYHGRDKVSSAHGGSTRVSATTFDSSGIVDSSDGADLLAENPSVYELGFPGVQHTEGTAGNSSVTYTVPSGKYWRLVGVYHLLVTDATAANRAVVLTSRTAADATIEAITHANVAASTTAKRTTLYGVDDYVVGNEAVAAQGTLTMDTNPTAGDTMTINGTAFTFVAALTGAENEILIGANVAATQVSVENAVGATPDGTAADHSVTDATRTALACTGADFSGNDMVFTATVKGTAGNSIATTETFTAGTNVFDAATLGTTTAGVDAADKLSTLDYPTSGVLLGPGEDVNISVTNGVAGDTLDTTVVYLEFDADPTP